MTSIPQLRADINSLQNQLADARATIAKLTAQVNALPPPKNEPSQTEMIKRLQARIRELSQ